MKKATYSFLAIAALMAMSCLKTEEFVAPEENTPHLQTFTAVIPSSPDTKVSLDNSGKTEWKINDKILIHGKYTEDNVTVTLDGVTNTISADGKTATFTADLSGIRLNDTPGDKYYAVYPAEAYDEYSSGRGYHANCFSNTNTLLLSGRYNEAGNSFVFLNVTGALSFTVDGSSFGGFDEFKLVGKNDEVVGYTHFVTRARSDDQTFHSGDTSGEKTFVRADVNDDGTTLNYVYFPTTQSADTDNVKGQRATCVDFTGGFIIYFLNGGVITHQVSTSTPVRVERQGLVRLGALTAGVKPYVEPEHHSSITGATDLSSSQANCYVISAAGAYKFPALKGNSNESIGTVKGVEILWETYNNAESVTKNSVISKVDYEGSEIFFETPATLKPGNALIAAKDALDNILWSWHIWIPSTAFTADKFGISSKKIMSRNLGALVDTEIPVSGTADIRSVGLYYQWGRKDPFVGYKFGPDETATEVGISGASGRSMTKSSTRMTVAQSIAAPTTFVAYKGDWLSTLDATLWGDGADKTIYDPCPAGYRVPAYNTSDPLWQSVVGIDGFSADKDARWWKLGTTVFPLAGCYDYDGGISHPYDRCWLWNTATNGNPDYGEAQYVYDNGGTWASQPSWGKRKACGVPIRCVVDNASAPVNIVIDGDLDDWEDVAGLSNGIHGSFKVASDADYLYFYSHRTTGGRYSQIWGDKVGYIYIGFDLDGDASNGVELNGNGPYDFIGFIYPYGGTSESPSINAAPGTGACAPDDPYTLSNTYCKGVVDATGAKIEFRIPRADLPTIPSTEITIECWGNKDLAKVTINKSL